VKTLHIINRHCNLSQISVNKSRPQWFSRTRCFESLLEGLKVNIPNINVEFSVFFDGDMANDHLLQNYKQDTQIFHEQCGSGASSYIGAIKYALSCSGDFFYFVEDDYLHESGWLNVLCEGLLHLPADYYTLYDHLDKYMLPMYERLTSQILISPSCHWRTTPSTTDTFACSRQTLTEDFVVHEKYSTGVSISRDHERFLALGNKGKFLLSSLPAFSTHVESEYLSPCKHWN
jgi:hypothetical protein